MADGWRRQVPTDDLTLLPLSDGGRDVLDVLTGPEPGGWRQLAHTVTGPDGRPRPVTVQHHPGSDAVLLSAEEVLAGDVPDLGAASSVGLGQALAAALELTPRSILVGLGQTAVHDGGAGLLAALGVGPGELATGGAGLSGFTAPGHPRITGLAAARDRFAGVTLTAAIREVDLPLLGLSGTSAVTVTERGATPEQAQQLERNLSGFAHACEQALGARSSDLLAGGGRSAGGRLQRLPGAGAGGGVGFGLAALGFDLRPGPQFVAGALGLAEQVAGVDLVVTGEGCFDWRSLRASVPAALAEAALAVGVPVIVIAGQVEAGRREITTMGIESAYALADNARQLADAMSRPADSLAARTARIARSWTR